MEGEACRGPSPPGGAATPLPGDVSGRRGGASSRRGEDASRGRGAGPSPPGEAASRRGDAPSPAEEVLSGPSPEAEAPGGPSPEAEALSAPILQGAVAPTHRPEEATRPAREDPSLPAAEGPIPRAAEGPSLVAPCRMEVCRPPGVLRGVCSASVRLPGPCPRRSGATEPRTRQEAAATRLNTAAVRAALQLRSRRRFVSAEESTETR